MLGNIDGRDECFDMNKPIKIGSNLFDKNCDFYYEGAIKMENVEDYFLAKDKDGNKHKVKMIKSDKVGVLWELFIYDEIVEE